MAVRSGELTLIPSGPEMAFSDFSTAAEGDTGTSPPHFRQPISVTLPLLVLAKLNGLFRLLHTGAPANLLLHGRSEVFEGAAKLSHVLLQADYLLVSCIDSDISKII